MAATFLLSPARMLMSLAPQDHRFTSDILPQAAFFGQGKRHQQKQQLIEYTVNPLCLILRDY